MSGNDHTGVAIVESDVHATVPSSCTPLKNSYLGDSKEGMKHFDAGSQSKHEQKTVKLAIAADEYCSCCAKYPKDTNTGIK